MEDDIILAILIIMSGLSLFLWIVSAFMVFI